MDPFSSLPFDLQLEQLKKYCNGDITINGDGSIDVDGDVFIDSCNLTKIPFKFRNVSYGFNCSNNRLISLEGAPSTVGGSFRCNNNNMLSSLNGGPTVVGGDVFDCSDNALISLDGAPNSMFSFWCDGNNSNLPYSEIFKIVDRVIGSIYYSSRYLPEDKDKIRRDRDVKTVLKDDELGDLDV
jgi:hypothetical protein